MAREKTVERERAMWLNPETNREELVTVLKKGKINSEIRTVHGFLVDVRTSKLDFRNVPEEQATLAFEPPTG